MDDLVHPETPLPAHGARPCSVWEPVETVQRPAHREAYSSKCTRSAALRDGA